jgi:1-acyl-sn-glycerol-3-phosphate acyltransferase
LRPTSYLLVGVVKLLVGAYARWIGTDPGPAQRIYFANHTSHIDTLAIWSALPQCQRRMTRPVAALDYWGGDGVRGFIGREVFDAVLIDRKAAASGQDALAVVIDAIGAGASLIYFPEGTRNTTDEVLLPLKSGLHRLARARPDIEIVPAWIDNMARVMPKGEFLPVPLLCSVTFGAPLLLQPDEDKTTFMTRVRDALLALKPDERER